VGMGGFEPPAYGLLKLFCVLGEFAFAGQKLLFPRLFLLARKGSIRPLL